MIRKLALALAITTAAGALAAPAPAAAQTMTPGTELGSAYNREWLRPTGSNSIDISDCVSMEPNYLRPTVFDGGALPYEIGVYESPDPCFLRAQMRILKIERLNVAGQYTFMNRGGGDFQQAHAHVRESALRPPPTIMEHRLRNGNGRAATGCTSQVYTAPRKLPGEMIYKENGSAGSSWANYGDPGELQGTHYSYVLWNLPRYDTGAAEGVLDGGGIIRAAIKPHTAFRACNVTQLYLDSFRQGTNIPNGWTRWAYSQVSNGYATIHGWVMVSYSYDGGPEVFTFDWA